MSITKRSEHNTGWSAHETHIRKYQKTAAENLIAELSNDRASEITTPEDETPVFAVTTNDNHPSTSLIQQLEIYEYLKEQSVSCRESVRLLVRSLDIHNFEQFDAHLSTAMANLSIFGKEP